MESVSFATTILTALPYFIQLEVDYLRSSDFKSSENENEQLSADFIVVGAGTAGCVVAARLSEHFSVLLLEAGGEPPSAVSVPAFDDYVATSPEINYFYKSIPQRHANNRVMEKSTGKMLGGTGSHNSIAFNRGNPKDFDNWAKLVNDTRWKYKNLLKYFRKFENYQGIWPLTRQHGHSGPVVIETNVNAILPLWQQAAEELGYDYADANGPQKTGFSPIEITRENGRRVSTYTAYIEPILRRKSLTVIRYAEAEKIIFSKKKAIAVQYLRHGKRLKVFATKEVIISASVFGSPILLFKSGLGPSEMLAAAGIKSILHLPAVGKYMENHAAVAMPPIIVDPSYVLTLQSNLTKHEFENFLNHKKSPVLSDNFISPQVFVVSSQAKAKPAEENWPDIQIYKVYNMSVSATGHPADQLFFDVVVGRPDFRQNYLGNLRLNTSAYLDGELDSVKLAIIDDKFLKSKKDRSRLKQGIKFVRKLIKTKGFRSVNARLSVDSECGVAHKANSISYWNCYINKMARPAHHTVGTCRMGRQGDRDKSVVDSKFRVHGIKSLRIVDGSVMPRITNAHLNGATILIGEKASASILRKYLRKL